MLKTFDVVLDLEKDLYSASQQLFTLSQSDFGSAEILFHIMQDDKLVDLQGMSVQLGIKRPSGTVFYQDCELSDAPNGLAQVLLAAPAYVDTGIYYAEVYIKDTEGDTAVSCPFYFGCREALTVQEVADPTLGQVDWANVVNKPGTYLPSPHTHLVADITDFGTGVAANIPTEYLTEAEGDARYAPYGTTGGGGTTTPAAWGGITGTLADQTDLQAELDTKANTADLTVYLTEAEGDARYEAIGTQPDLTGYLTTTDADARYQQLGTDTPDDWSEITGKPLDFPPSAHTHTSAQITDFAAAVAADIPAEYLTQTEGDARYNLKGTSGTASSVDWGNITGTLANQTDLQNALDAKANTTDIPDTTGLITQTDADARYQKIGTDTPDDWADITGKPSAFPPSAHTHLIADVSGLQTALDGKADDADLTGLLSQTAADARYQQIGTDTPDDWADITGKPSSFPPSAHTHTSADISDFGTAVAGAIPTEYLTSAEGDAAYQKLGVADDWANITGKPSSFPPSAHQHTSADVTDFGTAVRTTGDPVYQPKGTYLTSVPLMTTAAVGGAQVGNGLQMSGNYLLVKSGSGLGINSGTSALQVQDQAAAPITFWRGTQATYDAITQKDANTLYFISG